MKTTRTFLLAGVITTLIFANSMLFAEDKSQSNVVWLNEGTRISLSDDCSLTDKSDDIVYLAELEKKSLNSILALKDKYEENKVINKVLLNILKQDPGYELFAKGRKLVFEEKWDEAIRTFEELKRKFPNSRSVEKSLYYTAICYKEKGDLKKSFDILDTFIKNRTKSDIIGEVKGLRVEVADKLVKSGQDQYRKYIESGIGDDDPEIKIMAIKALERVSPEKAVPMLEKIIFTWDDLRLKKTAIDMLARKRNTKALKILKELALNDPNVGIKSSAISGLRRFKDEQVMSTFKSIFDSSNDPRIKIAVINAIRYSKSPAATQLIKNAVMLSAKGGTVNTYGSIGKNIVDLRGTAVNALSYNMSPETYKFLKDRYSKETNKDIKLHILSALGKSKTTETYNFLLNIAKTDKDYKLKKEAINRMRYFKDRNPEPELYAIFKAADNSEIKKTILYTLEQYKTNRALEIIKEVASQKNDSEMQRSALYRLRSFKKSNLESFVFNIYKSSDNSNVQDAAIEALYSFKTPASLTIIKNIVKEEQNPRKLRKALSALKNYKNSDAESVLRTIFYKTNDYSTKEEILSSLGAMKTTQALDFVRNVAENNENYKLRVKAIRIVGYYDKSPETAGYIIRYYDKTENIEVKLATIRALSHNRTKPAIDKLISIAKNSRNKRLRKSAIEYLGGIDDPRISELLVDILFK